MNLTPKTRVGKTCHTPFSLYFKLPWAYRPHPLGYQEKNTGGSGVGQALPFPEDA